MNHTKIFINKENLINNIKKIKRFSNKKISAVIKANAYGHGSKEVVKILNDHVDYFQVDDYLEFVEIKQFTTKKVLLTGYLSNDEVVEVIKYGGEFCINSLEQLKKAKTITELLKIPLNIHLKIDCFIGRQGLMPKQVIKASELIRNAKYLNLEGVFTHFSDVDNEFHNKIQFDCFKNCLEILEENGIKGVLKHINSTTGMLATEIVDFKTDINRIGIGLYGLWHSEKAKERYSTKLSLKPVLSWVTTVALVKELPKDYPVGYGRQFKTRRKTKIAVIPVGYSDGYDRGLSNKGVVIIKDMFCPIIGIISMNMTVVDVSEVLGVKEGDKVTIIGNDNKNSIYASDIAKTINTINYEVLSRISPKIPRIVI